MTEEASFDDPCSRESSGLPSGFRTAVSHALTEFGYQVVSWEADGVKVLAPDEIATSDDREHSIGLANLYRRTKSADRAEWPAMIREFFTHIRGTVDGPEIPADLAAIAGQLRPRLGRPFARDARAFPWGIPHPGTGLEINLVIDFPNTMAYVTDQMLATSSQSGDDLLDLALANLRAATGEDFLERVSEDLDIYIGHTGDGYDSARALLIEDLLPESPCGFLVAVPSRDELAVWPVSYAALEKVHAIKLFAEDNYRTHAYPITNEVFWVWQGTWYRFGIEVDESNVTLSPPDEFVSVLEQLGMKESTDGKRTN